MDYNVLENKTTTIIANLQILNQNISVLKNKIIQIKAIEFIREHRLWGYVLLPGVINLFVFFYIL